MNKLIFGLVFAAAAYGSSLTATTTCQPISGPVEVVMGPGTCLGGGFALTPTATGFDATFSLFPSAYPHGGITEIAVAFSDDLSFSQAGFATFYLDRYSNIAGSPFGQFPDGTVAGQSWSSGTIQVAVGPGQPVHIDFAADWLGQSGIGAADDGIIRLSLSKIEFTDLNGRSVPVIYDAMNGITYDCLDPVAVPEPGSVLLSALGLGVLAFAGRRKLRTQG
jgi:hypothetical protein